MTLTLVLNCITTLTTATIITTPSMRSWTLLWAGDIIHNQVKKRMMYCSARKGLKDRQPVLLLITISARTKWRVVIPQPCVCLSLHFSRQKIPSHQLFERGQSLINSRLASYQYSRALSICSRDKFSPDDPRI